jgi:hypothetical protein
MKEIARGEGITIVTSTHDRLVMEMADRIEELVDGHLAGVGGADVWRHVQAKERSPFAAPLPGHEPDSTAEPAAASTAPTSRSRLSSLVGADTSQFSRPAEPAQEPPTVTTSEPATDGDEERDDDVMRWAPPGRR